MPQDADDIVIAANGSIMVAPKGTAAPADIGSAWPSGWVDLGLVNEDGVTPTWGTETEDIPAWQLLYPARRVVTGRTLSIAFGLRQWGAEQVKLAFGGGSIQTITGPPVSYRYNPPAPEALDERALGIEWEDGSKSYRLIVPRGMVTDDVESTLRRGAAADLPITFSILGSAGVDAWYLLTNDPAFATA